MTQTAFAIGPEGQVFWVDSDGNVETVSDNRFAMDISCGADGSVWVVSTQSGDNGNRICRLKDFPNNKSKWETLPENISGMQLAAYETNSCVVLGEDQSVSLVNVDGSNQPIAPARSAIWVSALAGMPIYILTDEIVDGGGVIKKTTDLGKTWSEVKNGNLARAQEVYTQIYGTLVFLNEDGAAGYIDDTQDYKIQLVSPPNTGLNLGLGYTNFWWVVSTEADQTTGGNLLKYWKGTSFDASNWVVTNPAIAAVKVAGV